MLESWNPACWWDFCCRDFHESSIWNVSHPASAEGAGCVARSAVNYDFQRTTMFAILVGCDALGNGYLSLENLSKCLDALRLFLFISQIWVDSGYDIPVITGCFPCWYASVFASWRPLGLINFVLIGRVTAFGIITVHNLKSGLTHALSCNMRIIDKLVCFRAKAWPVHYWLLFVQIFIFSWPSGGLPYIRYGNVAYFSCLSHNVFRIFPMAFPRTEVGNQSAFNS